MNVFLLNVLLPIDNKPLSVSVFSSSFTSLPPSGFHSHSRKIACPIYNIYQCRVSTYSKTDYVRTKEMNKKKEKSPKHKQQ